MSLQRDLTPELHQQPQSRDFNEAYTIIHVQRRDADYWMLLDYGTRAEHRIDMHQRGDDWFTYEAFLYREPGAYSGFTHEGRAGSDGKIVYAKSLQAAIDHLNGQT